DVEDCSLRSRDKRLSLNLPRFTPQNSFTSDCSDDSYVPMNPNASPPCSESDCSTDGYIPMSPVTAAFTFPASANSKVSSPLPDLPTDLEPPPVNRDLKPRRKSKHLGAVFIYSEPINVMCLTITDHRDVDQNQSDRSRSSGFCRRGMTEKCLPIRIQSANVSA
ncbi:hypothetical protein AB205_0057610, partial [Aquarana catesbeiana]